MSPDVLADLGLHCLHMPEDMFSHSAVHDIWTLKIGKDRPEQYESRSGHTKCSV